jgi:mitofusin
MEVRRDPRSFIFFIILLLIINSPEPQGQQQFNVRNRYDEVLDREWDELDLLNRTRYGDFDAGSKKWLNITGLREDDGFAWEVLSGVKQQAKEQSKRVLGEEYEGWLDGSAGDAQTIPVYHNVSGYVQGEWVRSSLSKIRHPKDLTNTSVLIENSPFPLTEFDRNLTGTGGPIRVHLTEVEGRIHTDENRTISEVSARIIIGDNGSTGGNWWEFVTNGVHFLRSGGIVLTTTSDRFGGIFALPHLQISQHLYSTTQELLNLTIHETIDRQMNRVYPLWNPWSSAVEGAQEGMMVSPHCEFILYLQEHPIRNNWQQEQKVEGKPFDVDWIEHELRYPTGSPLPRTLPLSMSMVGFSPDCGFVIESKGPPDFSPSEHFHLMGSKTEEFNDRARHGIIAFAVTLSLQLMFLINQMKETATPSTRNRVSFYTIAMLAVGDGFGFLALIFMHLFLGTSQLALYTTAFLSLFSVVFELRFLMDIWTVQVTEQMRQDRQQASTSAPSTTPAAPTPATTTPAPAPPQSDGLPLPATAARPTTPVPPVIITPDQDAPDSPTTPQPAGTAAQPNTPARAELGALYSRYCLLLIFLFFLTLQFTTVRSSVRAVYFDIISFLYLSFWVPQIYRNVMRNCRKALRWDFVLGQSAVRMIPIFYFYAVSDNVLFSTTDMRGLMVLGGWVWIQILALASQEVLGSRFFVREGWAPPAYDYHPILREDEEGATMPIGSSQSPEDESTSMKEAGESKGKGKKVFDCSICATDIEVPVIPAGGGSGSEGMGGMILQRRAYMVTPCRHIFHTPCLEGWMRYRLQCPNCREILPPL